MPSIDPLPYLLYLGICVLTFLPVLLGSPKPGVLLWTSRMYSGAPLGVARRSWVPHREEDHIGVAVPQEVQNVEVKYF